MSSAAPRTSAPNSTAPPPVLTMDQVLFALAYNSRVKSEFQWPHAHDYASSTMFFQRVVASPHIPRSSTDGKGANKD